MARPPAPHEVTVRLGSLDAEPASLGRVDALVAGALALMNESDRVPRFEASSPRHGTVDLWPSTMPFRSLSARAVRRKLIAMGVTS